MVKKDAAEIMFYEGAAQNEIAQVLGVANNTVTRWKTNGDWDERRTAKVLHKHTAEEHIWKLINWNLYVLNDQMEDMKSEGKKELIGKGDIDALTKLFSTIKGKQKSWNHYVTTIREFLSYLQLEDLDLAQKLTSSGHTDNFLNEKRKSL